jgi:hypothetical protein
MKTFRAMRQYRKDYEKMISSNIYTHGRYTGIHIANQKIQVLEMNIFTKVSDHTHPFYGVSLLFNCQTSKQKSNVKREVSTLLSKKSYS